MSVCNWFAGKESITRKLHMSTSQRKSGPQVGFSCFGSSIFFRYYGMILTLMREIDTLWPRIPVQMGIFVKFGVLRSAAKNWCCADCSVSVFYFLNHTFVLVPIHIDGVSFASEIHKTRNKPRCAACLRSAPHFFDRSKSGLPSLCQ